MSRRLQGVRSGRLKASFVLTAVIVALAGTFFLGKALRGDLRSYNAELQRYLSGYQEQDLREMSKVMCRGTRDRLPKTPEDRQRLWDQERRRLAGIPREFNLLRGEPTRAWFEVTIGQRREIVMNLDIVEEEGELRICPRDNRLLGEFAPEAGNP